MFKLLLILSFLIPTTLFAQDDYEPTDEEIEAAMEAPRPVAKEQVAKQGNRPDKDVALGISLNSGVRLIADPLGGGKFPVLGGGNALAFSYRINPDLRMISNIMLAKTSKATATTPAASTDNTVDVLYYGIKLGVLKTLSSTSSMDISWGAQLDYVSITETTTPPAPAPAIKRTGGVLGGGLLLGADYYFNKDFGVSARLSLNYTTWQEPDQGTAPAAVTTTKNTDITTGSEILFYWYAF